MKRICLLIGISTLLAIPSHAATLLELGSHPNVSLHVEGSRLGVGLGVDLSYQEFTSAVPFLIGDYHAWIVTPSVTTRFFLADEGSTRGYLEANVSREVAFVGGAQGQEAVHEDRLDDWIASLGVGLRASLNERLRLGGSVSGSARFHSEDLYDSVTGSTVFRIHLQYVLGS